MDSGLDQVISRRVVLVSVATPNQIFDSSLGCEPEDARRILTIVITGSLFSSHVVSSTLAQVVLL